MTRHYLKLILPIAAIFLALSLVARTLGGTQPPNPALAGFTIGCEGKPQPCWYGIVPGVTTVEEAIVALNQRDDLSRVDNFLFRQLSDSECVFSLEGAITSVIIEGCKAVELGDIITWFNEPDYYLSGRLWFRQGQISVIEEFDGKVCFKLRPKSKVYFMILAEVQNDIPLHSWKGFKPYWWYAKNEENPRCAPTLMPGY